MSEIEKMERYIERTAVSAHATNNFDMLQSEWIALACACKADPISGVSLAFLYGQAKGYRAAKAKARR